MYFQLLNLVSQLIQTTQICCTMVAKKVIFIIVCTCLVSFCESARILAIMPTPSYSHQIVFNPLWTTLNSRGHEITLFTTDPIKNLNSSNFRQVDWSFAYQLWHEKYNVSDIIHNFNANLIKCLIQYVDMMNGIIVEELEHLEVQKIIADKDEHFDLIVVEYLNPAMVAFSRRFSCPFVGVSPMDITNFAHEALGNAISPALFPDFISPYDSKMSFLERLINTFYYIGGKMFFKYYFYPQTDKIVRKYFGDDTPKLEDLQRDASMVFLNINPIIHNIRPLMGNMMTIGGGTHFESHISLPTEIKSFLDQATAGGIYFSLGTNVKSKDLSEETKNIFLKTFSKLPYKVLWKFEDTNISPGSNVMVKRWLPQQQILKHQNVKLFITQGGLQSLEEAIYNEVPIIALPTYVDQYSNVRRVVSKGMGVTLSFEQLTEQILTEAIEEVINNYKYKNKATELSQILKEQPISGLDSTVWWIEYILKHKGAKYIKHTNIPLHQYLLLDVIAFIALIVATTMIFLFILLKLCFRITKERRKGKVMKLE